jgi:hypothetical protein
MEINKHLSEEEIAIYADALNDGSVDSVSAEIQIHIGECNECAEEAALVAGYSKEYDAKFKKGKHIQFKSWLLPAAAAAGIAVFVILKLIPDLQVIPSQRESLTQVEVVNVDKLSEGRFSKETSDNEKAVLSRANKTENSNKIQPAGLPPKEALLALYTIDERLEKLFISSQNEHRGESVLVNSEVIVEIPGTDSLKWHNPRKEALLVEIFNNHGKRITSISSRKNSIQIPALNQGLYYWKLINQDFDLLFVGKINVK